MLDVARVLLLRAHPRDRPVLRRAVRCRQVVEQCQGCEGVVVGADEFAVMRAARLATWPPCGHRVADSLVNSASPYGTGPHRSSSRGRERSGNHAECDVTDVMRLPSRRVCQERHTELRQAVIEHHALFSAPWRLEPPAVLATRRAVATETSLPVRTRATSPYRRWSSPRRSEIP